MTYNFNTIVVPAKEESFQDCFLAQKAWYPVRLDVKRIQHLKWIGVYRGSPIRAITHYAEIESIKPWRDTPRYVITFDNVKTLQRPVPLGEANTGLMQYQRYTDINQLLISRTVAELFRLGKQS